jgi:23S rRNA pseudouridine955/2504/2580 synthase
MKSSCLNDKNLSLQVRCVTVNENYVNQRIDNFLLRELKGIPKSHIYKILRSGEVRINGKRAKPDNKLHLDDVVRIPPIRKAQIAEISINKPAMTFLQQRIIYEDDALIVLNKPSGMAAHGGSGLSYGVIEAMRKARPDIKHLELVHRLDKDTSGCMLLAKKRSMLHTLHAYLRESKMTKTYMLLVKGRWRGGVKKVDLGLLKNRLSSGERIVKVSDIGKDALTVFKPIAIFANASLLEAQIFTGKTHQIRVHAAYIGYPVAGDDKYGDQQFNKAMTQFGLKRLFLHAASVKFRLPDVDQEVLFTAPMDLALSNVLEQLKTVDVSTISTNSNAKKIK